MLYKTDQWGENIEGMLSDENVFRLVYGSVSQASTEGTCNGI